MIELRISQKVTAGNSSETTYKPDNAQTVIIKRFVGDSPINDETFCEIRWGSGVEWEDLWTISGQSEMPSEIERTGDGTKMISLRLVNDEVDKDVVMSAYALLKI